MTDRPTSAGFSRHIIHAQQTSNKSIGTQHQLPINTVSTGLPPASALSSRSSYVSSGPKKLSGSPTPTPVFERQPPPTFTSTYVSPSTTNSPFLYPSSSTPSSSSALTERGGSTQSITSYSSPAPTTSTTGGTSQTTAFHSHQVKLPRDNPHLPKNTSSQSDRISTINKLTQSSPYVQPSSGNTDDLHSIERAMLEDVGYFRERKPAVTVESLLKDKRESDKLKASRSKDMALINSILPTPNEQPPPAPIPKEFTSDMSLITSLTQRLATLEKICSKQAKSLGMKDVMISDLQSKVRSMEHSTDAALLYNLQNDVTASKTENDALKRQLSEMETFLNDYGLVWVGFRAGAGDTNPAAEEEKADDTTTKERSSPASSPRDSPTSSDPSVTSPSTLSSEIYFDVPQFLASTNELNAIASEGNNLRIHTTSSGVTKFLPPTSLDLILYRDGMWFRNGPLRSWSLPAAREFIRDVQEGYFPYELKEDFPDGVCLAVIDRSKQYCLERSPATGSDTAATKFQPFKGKGNRLEDGKIVESSPSPTPSTSNTIITKSPSPVLSAAAPPHVPLETFLSKLPSQVIQNGKVIDVRNDVKQLLTGNVTNTPNPTSTNPTTVKQTTRGSPAPTTGAAANTILVDTPALKLIQARESSHHPPTTTSASSAPLPPLPPIATLQIKLDPSDGSPPLLLKMFFDSTLADVRQYVDSVRRSATQPYELRTTYPSRIYLSDDRRTLLEAGLTPNASLFVRNKRPASGTYREKSTQPQPDESWSTPATDATEA